MRVDDVMSKQPLSIPTHATVNDALLILEGQAVRHLPVVDHASVVVGMLSDRDLAAAPRPVTAGSVPGATARTPLNVTVDALMCRDVLTVTLGAPLRAAAELMVRHKVGSVPVVDGQGRLKGLVSYVDILTSLMERM